LGRRKGGRGQGRRALEGWRLGAQARVEEKAAEGSWGVAHGALVDEEGFAWQPPEWPCVLSVHVAPERLQKTEKQSTAVRDWGCQRALLKRDHCQVETVTLLLKLTSCSFILQLVTTLVLREQTGKECGAQNMSLKAEAGYLRV